MGQAKRFRRSLGSNRWAVAASLLPIAADWAHGLFFADVNQWMRDLLSSPSPASMAWLLGLYAAYCCSLGFLGRLKPGGRLEHIEIETRDALGLRRRIRTTWPQALLFYPSLGFGVLLVMAVGQAVGLMSDPAPVSERLQQVALFGAVGIFFVHVGLAVGSITPRYQATQPHYFFRWVPIVVISELMLNLSTALWIFFLADPQAAPMDAGDKLLAMLPLAPLFLIFFAAPRFTFQSKHFTWLSFGSGVVFALWTVWGSLDVVRIF
jgi:hypothetical protein